MENKTTLRKMDLVTSVILIIVSICVFVPSVQLMLRTLVVRNREWFESAGLFPGIISVFLAICAVSLFLRARKDGARFDFFTKEKMYGLIKSREFKVVAIVIGMFAAYIFVLILPGRMYEIVTFIYLFCAMAIFQKKNKRNILMSITIAALSTAAISYCFGNLAMILLP